MKCQECQTNPATLHFTKIINGEKTEMRLCEQCAKNKGDFMHGQNNFSLHHLLSGLLNFEQPIKQSQSSEFSPFQRLKCEKCGMTYEQFAKVGRFGCANCYKTFDAKLDPLLRRVHSGNNSHVGKIPKRGGSEIHLKRKIVQLKQQMHEFIAREEFEKAAEIRDELRSLENTNDEREGG